MIRDRVTETKKKAGRGVVTSKRVQAEEDAVETPTISTPKKKYKRVITSATKPIKKKEPQRRARPETVLIIPAEGSRYAEVFRNLKQKVKPDTLDFKIRAVRKTKEGEVLIEMGPADDGRSKLSSAIKEAVGVGGSVRELVSRMEDEVLDPEAITYVKEVMNTVQKQFDGQAAVHVKVTISKKTFRWSLKTYVELSEEREGETHLSRTSKSGTDVLQRPTKDGGY